MSFNAVALKWTLWVESFIGGCTPIPSQLIVKSLFTNDLHVTVNLYSLANFGLKLISSDIVSFGNNVPKPSFGCTSTYYLLVRIVVVNSESQKVSILQVVLQNQMVDTILIYLLI